VRGAAAWSLVVAVCACSVEPSGPAPVTPATCTGDTTACLFGTATVHGFVDPPLRYQARLFREFPVAGTAALQTALADSDGTYAFSQLPPWTHYYVQVAADFGQAIAVSSVVGPLAIPSGGAAADVTIKPVQLTIGQQASAGGTMQLTSALAFVFDPQDGSPAKGASVTIEVGGTQVAMQESTQGGAEAYIAAFPTPAAAQTTYTVTTLLPGSSSPAIWHASAGTASFTPSITAPAANVTVPQGQPLTVSWPSQPDADEEVVILYSQKQGSWAQAYETAQPHDEDATSEIVPGTVVAAGPLLVNVVFASGHCAPDQDGCVLSDETAAVQVTAQ
jgi:hypothetical protein